jgi:hypothetical protein
MSFFRSRSRWGSYLALFALAFQLAVSFAHVHLDHLSPVPAGARAQLAGEQASAPSSRSDHEDLVDDLCPICSLIHLAGTLVPAEMPPVPLPQIFGGLRLKAAAAINVSASHRVHLSTRASHRLTSIRRAASHQRGAADAARGDVFAAMVEVGDGGVSNVYP